MCVYAHTHSYTVEYSALKRRNPVIYDKMDETEGYYAKWNKPDRKRQILYDVTFM